MFELGQINSIGISIFGKPFYEQYQVPIVSISAIVLICILYAIYQRLTRKEPGGLAGLWSKPPEREGKEFMRMRENERKEF